MIKYTSYSVFLQAEKQRSLENVMLDMATIEVNNQIEPINILNTFDHILFTGGHIDHIL